MLRTLIVASSCAGLLMGAAPAAGQQLYGSEQRAFEQVARAVQSFGYSPTLAGAEEVLAAAEQARNAFATAEAARDSRHERIHALYAEKTPFCQNNPSCSFHSCGADVQSYRNPQDWLPDITAVCIALNTSASWTSALRLRAQHHDAVGEYMDLVGIGDASAAGLAENTRLYMHAFERLRTDRARRNSVEETLDRYHNSAHELHGYAVNAHVGLHRMALNAISPAARAISRATGRLADEYFGVGIQNVRRAASQLDSAVNMARGAERNGQAGQAIDAMVSAMRQTVRALRTNLEAAQRAQGRPDPAQVHEPAGRPGRPAPRPEPADTFDPYAWRDQIEAAVEAAEQAASDAEAAARSNREPLWAGNACLNAYSRVANYSSRVSTLIYGNRFVPAREQARALNAYRERLGAAMSRAEAACDSIPSP